MNSITNCNYELRNAKHSRMPLKINYDMSNWNAAEIEKGLICN